jgi:hypothetical protein
MRPSWPRTEDLAFEPELAPLALLEAALALTVQSLIARNPWTLTKTDPLVLTKTDPPHAAGSSSGIRGPGSPRS